MNTRNFIIIFIFIWCIFGVNSFATNNADLQIMRLDITGMVPSFNKDITEYYLTIGTGRNNIEITAVPEDKEATVQITGNTELKNGLNQIQIEVISKDGTNKKTYTIHLTKTSDEAVANSGLENMAIENVRLSPEFQNNITQYKAEISNNVNKLNILAIPENAMAQVIIEGNENLRQGNNTVTIKVIAQDNITQRIYQINVYKRNNEEESIAQQEQSVKIERVNAALGVNEIDNNKQKEILNKQNNDNTIIILIIVFVIILGFIIIRNRKK